ncbi:MAG TPA: IS1380 family transposase [Verrucomicrobiota bacterium]|nr:IS1380 family transposase [Verrucomicrobiota bacterium]
MKTQCTPESVRFQVPLRREVVAQFDGGAISSDGGGLLLGEVERCTGILRQFAGCFTDHRDPELIEHTLEQLIAQRVYGLALGYEDLNDHDELRYDPLLATLVGKADPRGQDRVRARDRGKALAGKSTLNRLERTPVGADRDSRYKKITAQSRSIEDLFVELFLQAHPQPPAQVVLDLDATDNPLYGEQLGRFFHGYYDSYCYLPLYIFCGEHLLCAKLRPADIDASAGSVKQLDRIVARIRRQWPNVRILIRADSGFCREPMMAWCERNGVDYLLGLATNARLKREVAGALLQAQQQFAQTGQASRVFVEFEYQTLDSWSHARRVVAKAEHLAQGPNPRFVTTSIAAEEVAAAVLYEQHYCGRGDMENRIKEQQLYMFARRTSCATMRANQLRLWFSAIAYTLQVALRRLGLTGTELAQAQCHTIRLKLLKIGAQVRVTVRKVWISLSESFPYQDLFRRVYRNLRNLASYPLRC